MDAVLNDASSLLSGISRDVEREVRELEEDARAYVQSRKDAAQIQANAIIQEAEKAAETQSQAIRRNAESKAAIERRKSTLRVRDRIIQETLAKARDICARTIQQPEYTNILKVWIVEAAVGLSVERAEVNASKEELPLITDQVLREAERRTLELTGKRVSLTRVEDNPLPAQGLVLTAEGGHLAYNNQVPTRFLRSQTAIRKRIHEALFNEGI